MKYNEKMKGIEWPDNLAQRRLSYGSFERNRVTVKGYPSKNMSKVKGKEKRKGLILQHKLDIGAEKSF